MPPWSTQYLERGYAEDMTNRYRVPGVKPDVKGEGDGKDFSPRSDTKLFHSGKFSTRAKGLLEVEADGKLALNPLDAERWSIGRAIPCAWPMSEEK